MSPSLRTSRRRGTVGWVVVWCAVTLSGCVGMPTDGQVTEVPEEFVLPESDVFYQPSLPQDGETPTEVVEHFLDAMTATPIQTSVASQFLTTSARATWRPELSVVTYSDAITSGLGPINLTLTDAVSFDSSGRFLGEASEQLTELDLDLVLERGQWRINRLPDALIVPQEWFAQRFEAQTVYYFDTTGRHLVPSARFVPRGDQLASALVDALLAGPDTDPRVERTFFPEQTTRELPVTVDNNGVAQVALTGPGLANDSQAAALAIAQLSWTLRQLPEVSAFSVSVGGVALSDSQGEVVFGFSDAGRFDPVGVSPRTGLYGLAEGVLVAGLPPEFDPVAVSGLKVVAGAGAVALSLDAATVLAVSRDARRAEVVGITGTRLQDPWSTSGTALAPIGFDLYGDVWLLDRAPGGARVVVSGREVAVRGISSEPVIAAVISRDGTRLLAIVDDADDRLVSARIRRDEAGRVTGALPAEEVGLPPGSREFVAITWNSPTSVAVLGRVSGGLSQVLISPIDGSALGNVSTNTLPGRYRWLAGSPVQGSSLYAISRSDMVDLTLADSSPLPVVPSPSTLRYVG